MKKQIIKACAVLLIAGFSHNVFCVWTEDILHRGTPEMVQIKQQFFSGLVGLRNELLVKRQELADKYKSLSESQRNQLATDLDTLKAKLQQSVSTKMSELKTKYLSLPIEKRQALEMHLQEFRNSLGL